MCDYSLESRQSRPAVVGERLETTNFGCGTRGFASVEDGAVFDKVAVCLLPGTELAFDAPVKVDAFGLENMTARTIEHKVARFTKINTEYAHRHHDGLEFPDQLGVEPVLLTHLISGQVATVLQMPAEKPSIDSLPKAELTEDGPAPTELVRQVSELVD